MSNSSDIDELKEEKANMMAVCLKLKKDITALQAQMSKTRQENGDITDENEKLKGERDILGLAIRAEETELQAQKDKVRQEVNSMNEVAAAASALRSEIAVLEGQIAEKNTIINSRLVEIEDGEQEYANLQKSMAKLLAEIKNLQGNHEELERQIMELVDAKVKMMAENKKIDGQIVNAGTRLQAILDECHSKEHDLRDREGYVMEKEAWLKEKEQKLRAFKMELEKYYGKRITTINI